MSPDCVDTQGPLAAGSVYTYLTMTSGSRAGTSYLLDPPKKTASAAAWSARSCSPIRSARGCMPSSRSSDNAWKIRDAESRNGTFVNGQKIDDAVLATGNQIRLGSTEFCFQQSESSARSSTRPASRVTQTLIKNQAIDQGDAVAFRGVAAISDSQQAQELLLLYQLSIKLLGCDEPDEVVRVALELLADWTHATLAGFLWISDDGQLKPKMLIPAAASDAVALSKSLTELVCRQKQRRLDRQRSGTADSLGKPAALCRRAVRAADSRRRRRWARSTSIWSMAGFGRRISISPFRWPTSRPWPWPGHGAKAGSTPTTSTWSTNRPATAKWSAKAGRCAS